MFGPFIKGRAQLSVTLNIVSVVKNGSSIWMMYDGLAALVVSTLSLVSDNLKELLNQVVRIVHS